MLRLDRRMAMASDKGPARRVPSVLPMTVRIF